MGRSITSYLVYGFKLEYGYEELDEKFFDKFFDGYSWEETLAEFIFAKQGKTTVSEEEETQLIKNLKVEFNGYGYADDDLEWVLCIKGSEKQSYDGQATKISLDDLKIDIVWEKQLKLFCELVDLKFREPSWLLVGSYS